MASKDKTAESKPLSPWIKVGVPLGITTTIIIFWAAAPGVAFWFFQIYGLDELSGPPTFQDLGVVGDSFGLMNALFSGGALVGVIVAIFLQSRELKLMHVEMRGQKEQLEGQRQALDQSNLDGIFFQMLRLRNDIIEGLSREQQKEVLTGYQFITMQAKVLLDSFSKYRADGGEPKNLQAFYSWYWNNFERALDHYYSNLETILELIDDCDYAPCLRYMRILAGQLSLDEKKLLFYHAAADDRTQRRVFCERVARAGLVDGLEYDWLVDKSHPMELKRMQGLSVLNPDNQKVKQEFFRQKMDMKFQEEMRRENRQ